MAVNCRQCKYYFITWEKVHPYGCKAFGFKTAKAPSLSVFESSGKECTKYAEKNLKPGTTSFSNGRH